MPIHSSRYAIVSPVLAVLLAGCATDSDRHPSLAIRDFERVQGTFEVASGEDGIEPPIPASATSIEQVAQLLSQARQAHLSFLEFAPEAERQLAAAQGLSPDDNQWAESQLAFAELDTKRSQVAIMLGDLDLMFADTSLSYQELSEIEAAREEVRKLVAEEDSILRELATTN